MHMARCPMTLLQPKIRDQRSQKTGRGESRRTAEEEKNRLKKVTPLRSSRWTSQILSKMMKRSSKGIFLFDQVEGAPDGAKRQRSKEMANVEMITRKGLREALIAKANELKSMHEGCLEAQMNGPGNVMPKKRRRKGDDAITRLINAGRD